MKRGAAGSNARGNEMLSSLTYTSHSRFLTASRALPSWENCSAPRPHMCPYIAGAAEASTYQGRALALETASRWSFSLLEDAHSWLHVWFSGWGLPAARFIHRHAGGSPRHVDTDWNESGTHKTSMILRGQVCMFAFLWSNWWPAPSRQSVELLLSGTNRSVWLEALCCQPNLHPRALPQAASRALKHCTESPFAHLFRLLLEGTTGCAILCGGCQRKLGKTS